MIIRKPVGDPARQPKAMPFVPKPERKTREPCAFCRKVRSYVQRVLMPGRAS